MQSNDYEVPPSGEALRLHEDAYLNEILDGMEREGLEACISANPSDHEARQFAALEVRAIRTLRVKLRALAEGKVRRKPRVSMP